MIEVSDSTRSGWRIASVWAIIPPSEAPDDVRGADAQMVEQLHRVVRHVVEQVGGSWTASPIISAGQSGTGPS